MTDTRPPAAYSMVRSRWTSKDEATLQELLERKKRIDEQNREPLRTLVAGSCPLETLGEMDDVTDWLAENATQLRALLAPFDHTDEG